jgi:hypothetical protein
LRKAFFEKSPAEMLFFRREPQLRRGMKILLLAVLAISMVSSAVAALSAKELDAIGRRVWQNECGGTRDGLTSWNANEGFASLGIGHFIWYPKGQDGPYQESFPELVRFLGANGVAIPDWLKGEVDCPWNSKAEFQASFRSARMNELRDLLAGSIREQSRFLALRMEKALPKLLSAAPAGRRDVIASRFKKLTESGAGTFALIDYVNFKGEGTNPKERYRGEGWGLLQVLDGMSDEQPPVKAFSESAARVLTKRVQNAAPKEESQWLKGWTNRVRSYAN